MSKKKPSQINSIIDAISKNNDQNVVDIFVPSVNDVVKFLPLTVQHQKRILSGAIDATVLNTTSHSILVSKIIQECVRDQNITFYAVDRAAITIGLRVNTLGFNVPVMENDENVSRYDIKSHYEAFNTHTIPGDLLEEKIVTVGDIKLTIKPPTLKEDTTVNTKVLPIVGKNVSDNEKLKQIIGESVVHEYVKYIKKIEIAGNTMQFDYNHANQLARVVESLPMNVVNKLIEVINTCKQYEDVFTTVKTEKSNLSIVTDARFYSSD